LDGFSGDQLEQEPVVILPTTQVRISAYDNNNNNNNLANNENGENSERVSRTYNIILKNLNIRLLILNSFKF
jgi:hypothetical protein